MCFLNSFLFFFQIETKDSLTSLTIFKAMPEDTGLITCRAKNQAGTAECSAELYVQRKNLIMDILRVVLNFLDFSDGICLASESLSFLTLN